jgi:ribonuclease P protein component
MEKLLRRAEFLAVAAKGKRYSTSHVRIEALSSAGFRLGLTASKRVGNAVLRNKAKRRLRAVMHQLNKTEVLAAFDVVLIAKPVTSTCDYAALVADVRLALIKTGVLSC